LLCLGGVRVDETLVEWLDTGWRVFKEGRRDANRMPPWEWRKERHHGR
jgi:hypothetical protein